MASGAAPVAVRLAGKLEVLDRLLLLLHARRHKVPLFIRLPFLPSHACPSLPLPTPAALTSHLLLCYLHCCCAPSMQLFTCLCIISLKYAASVSLGLSIHATAFPAQFPAGCNVCNRFDLTPYCPQRAAVFSEPPLTCPCWLVMTPWGRRAGAGLLHDDAVPRRDSGASICRRQRPTASTMSLLMASFEGHLQNPADMLFERRQALLREQLRGYSTSCR